jgi:hypothetical protein
MTRRWVDRLCERVSVITENDLFSEAEAIAQDLVGSDPRDDAVVLLVRYSAG